MDFLRRRLLDPGISAVLVNQKQSNKRLGYDHPGNIWRLNIWQFGSVNLLLGLLSLRHPEKFAKAKLGLESVAPISHPENVRLVQQWENLSAFYEEERIEFIELAKQSFEDAHRK